MTPLVFNDTLATVLFGIVVTGWIAQEAVVQARTANPARTAEDRGTYFLLAVSLAAAIWVPVMIGDSEPPGGGGWAPVVVGLLLAIAGIGIRVWSIHELGRFFTLVVTVADDQRVIDTGPYRLVRHPSYTGSVLAFTGVGLVLGGPLGALAGFIIPLPALLRRIAVEERELRSSLPGYDEYMRRTKRLIPGVL